MSKPENEELAVDFSWAEDEVEDTVDDEMALEDQEQEEVTEEQEEEETTSEVNDVEESEDVDDNNDEIDETKDEEEAEEAEDLSVVESVKRHLGYDFEEEFEDSEEGLQLLVESASNKKADEVIDSYFDEYPDVKELLEYRRMGGDPDKFFQTKFPSVDYEKVELDADNEKQQEQFIRQELSEIRGYTKEEVDAELEGYRNGGILEDKAKRSLAALKNKQKQDQTNLLEQQQQEQEKQKEELKNYWSSVKETIDNSTNLQGFKIPSKDKEAFFNYLSKPVEDGKSQAMINAEQAELDKRIAIDYLMFKNFDLADIVDRKAKQQNAKTLRERMRPSKLNKKQTEESESNYTEELGTI